MRGAAHPRMLLALLALLAAPATARAVPVVERDTDTINLDGSLKSFFYLLHYPHYPRALLAVSGVEGDWASAAAADVRLKLEGNHARGLSWSVHFHTQPQGSSLAAQGGADGGGTLGALGFASAARPPRLLPLQATEPNGVSFAWRHEFDRLNVRLRLGKVDLIVGRQPVSFGVGFVWQPADLVGTFSPVELDGEYKPGVDAVRVNVALGDFTELAVVGAFGGPSCQPRPTPDAVHRLPDGSVCTPGSLRLSAHHSVALTRFRTNVHDWDVGGVAGWVRGDLVAGLFATGTIGRVNLRSEAVYTFDLERDETYAGSGNDADEAEHFARAVLGADFKFDTERLLVVLAELYYNGFGTFDSDAYLERARRPRVAELGEIFNLGKLYLAAGVQWEPHEKLPLSATVIANLHDPSAQVSLSATYNVGDESVVVFGALLPLGEAPQLTASSGTTPTASPLRARSELGLYPWVYYMIWKAYF